VGHRGKQYTRTNPATLSLLKDLLGEQTDVVEHHRAMAYERIGDFMPKLRAFEGIGSPALEWLILTATRTDETLGATWEEIDRPKKIWHIPGGRRKGKKGKTPDLVVQLSDRCIAILGDRQRFGTTGLIFQGIDGELSENTLRDTLVQRGASMGRFVLAIRGEASPLITQGAPLQS
jgi:integrase